MTGNFYQLTWVNRQQDDLVAMAPAVKSKLRIATTSLAAAVAKLGLPFVVMALLLG